MQIAFDGRIAELFDDDGKEQGHRLKGYTLAHLDVQDDPAGWVFEDA